MTQPPPDRLPPHLHLDDLAARLTEVDGIVGVVLGGSRARGTHTPESDVDLGLYYRGDLDVAALNTIAQDVAGPEARVTAPGEWGPWVDGGGWLVVEGLPVDWIYRDVGRVREAWARAHRGTYDWNTQPGHPLGVPDFAYVGELALAHVLADPSGELGDLKDAIDYPEPLAVALQQSLWEADFLVQGARKATGRGDATYVALCLSRALLLCAHAIHGRDRHWLVNEKGAMLAAADLPSAPTQFADRAAAALGEISTSQTSLDDAVDAVAVLVAETRSAVSGA